MVLMGASFCMFDASASALTTVPTKTNFQGRLTSSAGNIMPDGLYNMKFRLFTVSSGGTDVWNETRETTNRVQVTNGLFSVRLGDVTPIPASLFASGNLYFEVELPTPGTATCSTAACASFTEGPMTPRNQMATSAYAYNSETLDGLDSSNFVQLGQGVQTDAGTASSIFINKTASGNLIQLQSASTDAFVISNTGAVTTGTWQGSTVGVQYGGTGQSSYAIGDLLYASGATTLSKLAAGVANSCLTSQGAGTAPAWADCEDDTLAAVTGRGGSTSSNLVFNGTLAVTSDVTLSFAGTENLVINSDLAGSANLLQITGTPSTTAGTTRGVFVQQADSANTNGLDTGIYINNADTDLAITNAIHINNNGGGGYTNLINATTFTVTGAGAITNGTWNAGTVSVQYGGTGAASFTSGGLLYGNGTGAIQATSAGGASQCLLGGATPTWGTCNLQTAYDRSTGSTTPEIKLDSTRGGLDIQDANSTINSDLLTVRTGNASGLGTAMFSVASNGAITAQNISDSNAAFTISRAGTTGSIFVADTSNSRIQIGDATADSTGVVLVLDSKDTTDPTGVNGAMYYNTTMRSFRCYQNGVWRSCLGGLAYANTAPSGSINSTAADTAFDTKHTIPAGSCQTGRVYRVTARGVYSTYNAGLGNPGNITLRVKVGGTTVGATVPPGNFANSLSNQGWRIDLNITCANYASNLVEAQGFATISTSTSAVQTLSMSNASTIAVPSLASAQDIEVTADWGTANAGNTITLRQLVVEELGP